jgi:Zn-dependent protease with chaperone function
VIYTNLLYFLIAIFTFSMATVPAKPDLSGISALLAFVFTVAVFDRYLHLIFRRAGTRSAMYFRAEKHASIAALLVYSLMIFGLDLKYHLSFLSLGNRVPGLINIGGLVVFLCLFILVWRRARKPYELAFAKKYSSRVFILSNLKTNLPIVIPWMILTFCYDLINFIDLPWVKAMMKSSWSDVVFFALFFIFVITFMPSLVLKLWGCRKLKTGPLYVHLKEFCSKQNFKADIYIWPLFEGRVITAGVMGIVPGLRYLLVTPALVETMTVDELDAVMAHEIGHVKRFHLLLYVFLVGGFAIVGGFLAEPLIYSIFSMDYTYSFISRFGLSPEFVRNFVVAVPTFIFLLLYFRYIFGYFMRNFERQADLHVFPVLGNGNAIISAFEKIAILSGNIRDQPSWHHFGIGQRIDFLRKCERDPAEIGRHNRKVGVILLVYVVILLSSFLVVRDLSFEEAKTSYEEKYLKADLVYNANQEENPALWLFFAGNYYLTNEYEKSAITAFELAMERSPLQPDFLNNFSWLLLTSKDTSLRNPQRALDLARMAAQLKPQGYILDTLATALWANNLTAQAIDTEEQAILIDSEKQRYYQEQINRFKSSTYEEELQTGLTENMPASSTMKPEIENNGSSGRS